MVEYQELWRDSMDNIDLENLGDQELVELLEILKGMEDELDSSENETEGEKNGEED